MISGDGARLDVWAKAEEGALNFLHQETHEPPSEFSGTQQAFVDLVTALETERHTGISPAEIECAQAILFAVPYSSLLDGRRVTLDEVPENFTVMGKTGAFYA